MTQLDSKPAEPKDEKRSPMTWLVAAAAVIAIVIASVGLFVNRDNDAASTGPPTLTYVGDGCTYTGPTDFKVGSTVTFTFVNETGNSVGFGVWAVDDNMTTEEILDEGIMSNGSQIDLAGWRTPDSESFEFWLTFDQAGTYALNCADRTEGQPAADYAHLFTVTG